MASILSNLLSQAKAQVSKQVSNVVNGPIAPDTLRSFLRAQPAYVDNRERAAVVLDKGFKAYDVYVAYKTPIFIASVLGAIGSATMLTKRRGHGSEAVTLWTLSFVTCATAAWFTRPGTVEAAPANLTGTDKTDFGVVATIDKQREALRSQNPAFADDVFNRLANMPGIREPLAENPLVRAAVV